jgi:hypothetical protein
MHASRDTFLLKIILNVSCAIQIAMDVKELVKITV